jgi:hypothetical protein
MGLSNMERVARNNLSTGSVLRWKGKFGAMLREKRAVTTAG